MTDNTIRNITWEQCSGCCGCQNVCPVDAIHMEDNFQGFIHPVIDNEKCINCGKCLKQCPINEPVYRNSAKPECRAILAKDEIRIPAASGGIFSAFAQVIIERGGVICGAVYNDDFSVKHIIAENLDGLNKIRSSKYVQSNAGMIYRQVRDILDTGREVLFSGCPCQVAALYSYLEHKDYDNLYTMDLICHGVPSHAALRQYLKEYHSEKKIKSIDFRDKSFFGWSSEMNIYYADGSVFRKNHTEDAFYKAFLPCLSVRRSCGTCPFSCIPRQGDWSIGDFWGIARYDKTLDDKKGTSLLLVNNAKGKKMMKECGALWDRNEKVPISEGLVINKTIANPYKSHPARGRFFENLGKIPYSQLVDKCLSHHYDIGIVGLWYGLNYGSVLTYYALYRVVNAMGYDAIMINKPQELWTPRYADRKTIANKFIYKHCYVSNTRKNMSEWRELSDHCDNFIVGSDVVWNYQICGHESKQFFFLDFVKDEKKKIAMACSFGSGYDAPEQERLLSSYYLRKFDYIGVREKEGVEICKTKLGVKADSIMDPVFLCDKNIYHILADSTKLVKDSKFITTYLLGPDKVKSGILKRASERLGLPLKNIANPNDPKSYTKLTGLTSLNNPSVEEWLFYIKNADFFIGDSFHGLCFSLIFNVPFLIIVDSNISGLARFTTLLGLLGLKERLVFTDKDDYKPKERLLTEPIDYEKINKTLASKSEKSYQWLLSALRGPKQYKLSAQEIIISQLQDKIYNLEKILASK